ncbi:MAG: FHA domain-containing protein [Candidatus Omnitrophica bacterium]|nr:FHA domain-containing protein [Candidatus Omnitrophota bacterium]
MEKIIIEIISDHRHQSEHKIFDKGEVRVGRGLENDLIINDPHVSENHLIIRLEDGKLTFTDFQSLNGTYVLQTKHFERDLALHSGDELIIGRTRLKIFLKNHQVAATKPLSENKPAFRWMHQKRVAWSLLMVLMVVSYIETHLTTTENETIQKLLSAPIIASAIILIWAGFWSFLGRLLCHRIYFTVHISLCCLWMLIHDVLEQINDYVCFYLNNQLLHLIINYIIYSGMFILLLSFTLLYASNLAKKARIIFSTVFTLLIAIFVTGMRLSVSDDSAEYYLSDLPYDATLKPPIFGPPKPMPIDKFVEENNILYKGLIKEK